MMKIFCSAWFLINFSIVMDAVGLLVQEKHGSFDKVIQTSTGSFSTSFLSSSIFFFVQKLIHLGSFLIARTLYVIFTLNLPDSRAQT